MSCRFLDHAASLAVAASQSTRTDVQRRAYSLAAVGEGRGRRLVSATNATTTAPATTHHAEARLLRRTRGRCGDVVYVARCRADGAWANARPCAACRTRLAAAGVVRVVYTTERGAASEDLARRKVV